MKLGIIGYGRRISHVAKTIIRHEPACRISAIVDVRNEEIRHELGEEACKDIQFFETTEEMLQAVSLDGILIGTRCNLHAEIAAKVLPLGIPLFLEKPVAITLEELHLLKAAYESANHDKVVVSFPLRAAPIVRKIKEVIDSGKIGRVEHVQAHCNVPYGRNYFHTWMRDESLTGGLFLQKATHDLDYINYLLGFRPVKLAAMTSKQVFKGSKPAGLQCIECDEKDTCPESQAKDGPDSRFRWCSFAEDTGNEDSGSILLRYDTGMHVSYSQNFLARGTRSGVGIRGARFIGYEGTLSFDFYNKDFKVFLHNSDELETYRVETDKGHHGGDDALAENFIDIMKGKALSVSRLEDGLLSALLCLKAKQSSLSDQFQDVKWDR